MTEQDIDAKVLELCGGNLAAVDFINGFWGFMETWDDLVDRDKPVTDEAINGSLLWALFWLHDNLLYQAYPVVLRGAMQQAVASWQTANRFERSGDRALVEQAYFMRCAPYDVFAVAVMLVAGPAAHREAVAFFRSLAPEDSLESYLKEHLGDKHGLV